MALFHFIFYIFILTFLKSSTQSDVWDIAVARDGALEFMTADGAVTSVINQPFNDLAAITYDPMGGHVYLTDSSHDNSSIFQVDVGSKKVTALLPKQTNDVKGIAYDPETSTLYWTNGHGRTISTIKAVVSKKPTVLISFVEDEIPMGIALDNCRKVLYWTNSNHLKPTIEQANLDGSNRQLVIKNDLFQPLGIAVDQATNKLFWSDDRDGIYFKIERSNLDGSQRKTLIESVHHQPFSITVDGFNIYWTDWIYNAVWSIPKSSHGLTQPREPKMIHRYRSETPMGLVARVSMECHEDVSETSEEIIVNDSTTHHHELVPILGCDPVKTDYCLNSGVLVNNQCQCRAGYTGGRCEIPACFNYCIHGSCYLNVESFPQCQCREGFSGDRCEIDTCRNYCLNDGKCTIVRGQPVCSCSLHYQGRRCTDDFLRFQLPENTSSYIIDDSSTQTTSGHCISDFEVNKVILISVGAMALLLLPITIGLAIRVYMLKKRPRIKKHFVVKKNVTPLSLTSRPQQGEQCEITIENCCNMNICETPCFEPQLRTSKTLSRREEKKNLLGSMEEESSSCKEDLY